MSSNLSDKRLRCYLDGLNLLFILKQLEYQEKKKMQGSSLKVLVVMATLMATLSAAACYYPVYMEKSTQCNFDFV